jgi:UbiD family decarboxylase
MERIPLRTFIEAMKQNGQVITVEEPCSAEFEAPRRAAGTDRMILFQNLDGRRAVMNVTATRSALARALKIPEAGIVKTLADTAFEGIIEEQGRLNMQPPDILSLPVMKHFPLDAGRYITAGIVFSEYGGVANASIHRMLVLDGRHLAARLVEGRHTHTLHRQALENGEKLPIAITIGTHPAVTFAASTRVPPGRELHYAAGLMGGTLPVRECKNGVKVPDAEIVIEGYIGSERAAEGPFVDITGTYDPVRQEPVIELTGMHMKKDPIYHGILPGGNEHKILMGMPYEPSIYRAVGAVTGIRNVMLTTGGCGYLHAIIQIEKRTQGDAKNAIMAAFAAHTSLKHVVVVDADIAINDPHDVEYALATRVRGDRDVMVITGVRGSSLDPCRLKDGTNVKIGIDATMVMGEEEKFRRAEWS